MHSGLSSGITPNPFNILASLVSRIVDFKTNKVIPELYAEVPEHRKAEIKVILELNQILETSLMYSKCEICLTFITRH